MITVGEAIGLVHDLPKAGEFIAETSASFKKFAPASITA
jgi:hypothetical protein